MVANQFTFEQFDVGHGGFFVGTLSHPQRMATVTYVFDFGSLSTKRVETVVDHLVPKGSQMKVEFAFISHFDRDHINAASELARVASIRHLVARLIVPLDLVVQLATTRPGRSSELESAALGSLAEAFASNGGTRIEEVEPWVPGTRFLTRDAGPPDGEGESEERPNQQEPRDPTPTSVGTGGDRVASGVDILGHYGEGGVAPWAWELVAFVPPKAVQQTAAFLAQLRAVDPRVHALVSSLPGVEEPWHQRVGAVAEFLNDAEAMETVAFVARRIRGFGDLNHTSLALYSAPIRDQPSGALGWLHTGDLPLEQESHRDNLNYCLGTTRRNRVATLALAHHGARDGWHSQLLCDFPSVTVGVSSEGTRYGRPLRSVLSAVSAVWAYHSTARCGGFGGVIGFV